MSQPTPPRQLPLQKGWFPGYKPPSKLQLLTGRLHMAVNAGTLMYDSIYPDNIPANAQAVAGYGPPNFAWPPAGWARFPNALRVEITNRPSENYGHVLDWETGNEVGGTPQSWIAMRKAAGIYRPTIYCNGSTVPQVRQLTGPYLLGEDYDIWVADWTNSPHPYGIPYGYKPGVYVCPVTQYADPGPYDLSVIYDSAWPHVSAPVTPWPAPTGLKAAVENTFAADGFQTASLSWNPVRDADGNEAGSYWGSIQNVAAKASVLEFQVNGTSVKGISLTWGTEFNCFVEAHPTPQHTPTRSQTVYFTTPAA